MTDAQIEEYHRLKTAAKVVLTWAGIEKNQQVFEKTTPKQVIELFEDALGIQKESK